MHYNIVFVYVCFYLYIYLNKKPPQNHIVIAIITFFKPKILHTTEMSVCKFVKRYIKYILQYKVCIICVYTSTLFILNTKHVSIWFYIS